MSMPRRSRLPAATRSLTDKQATQRNTLFVKLQNAVLIALIITGAIGALPTPALATIRLGTANTASLNNGLVGYWPLDGAVTSFNTNTTMDISGTGNTGQLIDMSTTTSPVAGKIGQALQFDGINSYVVTGNLTLADTYTVSAWVKPTGPQTSYARIAESNFGAGFYLGTNVDGTAFEVFVNNVPGPTGGAGTVGTWSFVTLRYDGVNLQLYVNGVIAGTLPISPVGTVTLPVYIGKYFNGAGFN